jgi:putative aldouronate transport system permease protein
MMGRGIARELTRNRTLYLMTLPALAFFVIFAYLPMPGIIIAFKDYNAADGIYGSAWNGLRNFAFLVISGDIYRITWNTLRLNVLFIVFGTASQVAFAILLNEVHARLFKKVVQSFVFFPYFVSWVVVGSLTYNLFASEVGSLNALRGAFGLGPVEWYSSPSRWTAILTIAYVWKWIGFGSIIYLAAIHGIDATLYEAARIDGANRWVQARAITLPLLLPTIITLSLMAIGRIFYGDFGLVLNLVKNNAILYQTTDVIDTYVYRAFSSQAGGSFPAASAAGVYQSLMGFVVILAANSIVRRIDRERALF